MAIDSLEPFCQIASVGFPSPLGILGLAVAGGIFIALQYRCSSMWRRLAKVYEATGQPANPIAKSSNQSACLFSGVPQRYLSAIDMAVTEQGLYLRVNRAFALFYPFHRPIFVPHDELAISPTSFWLDCYQFKLQTDRVPGVEVLVPADTKRWYDESTGRDGEYEAKLLLRELETVSR